MENKIALPKIVVARASRSLFALNDTDIWDSLPKITPLWLADGTSPASQATFVRVCFDDDALYVRFDCSDMDIWGTYTQRDEPTYEQEVVEIFMTPGADDPIHYFEFQVSPNGVLFDAKIFNPTSTRADLQVDAEWNCPNIRWTAERNDAAHEWWAALAIPWSEISTDARIPPICRANFYRIERPHTAETEYSCWSPTMTSPADFHKPARFGILEVMRNESSHTDR
jgi:hypothetical protein